MDLRKIKHKIALTCNGNMREYFEKVEIVNKLYENYNNSNGIEFIHRINDANIMSKQR